MSGIGRRDQERYAIELPAQLAVVSDADSPDPYSVALRTKNISSSGAFFVTDQLLGKGTLLDIDLTLPFHQKKDGVEKKSSVQIKGEVVRVEPGGMAVRFAGQYHFTAG